MKILMKYIKKESLRSFIAYVMVGGLATIVEWVGFYFFDAIISIPYLIATALAFIFSTFANWAFGRLFLFKAKEGKNHLLKELIEIYLASIFGLLFNLLIMWIIHGRLEVDEMIAKIMATGIVFIYNYLIRKLIIYKR